MQTQDFSLSRTEPNRNQTTTPRTWGAINIGGVTNQVLWFIAVDRAALAVTADIPTMLAGALATLMNIVVGASGLWSLAQIRYQWYALSS
jgi:hypothetical protein